MPRRAEAAERAGHERLARELWSAVADGDADSLRRLLAPEVVWRSIGLNPLSGEYRGPDDVVAYFADIGHRADELSSSLEQIWTGADGAIVGYEAELWFGVIAPAGTPDAIVERLNKEIVRFIKSDFMKKRLADQGARAIGTSGAEFLAFMRTEQEKWGKVLTEIKIKAE